MSNGRYNKRSKSELRYDKNSEQSNAAAPKVRKHLPRTCLEFCYDIHPDGRLYGKDMKELKFHLLEGMDRDIIQSRILTNVMSKWFEKAEQGYTDITIKTPNDNTFEFSLFTWSGEATGEGAQHYFDIKHISSTMPDGEEAYIHFAPMLSDEMEFGMVTSDGEMNRDRWFGIKPNYTVERTEKIEKMMRDNNGSAELCWKIESNINDKEVAHIHGGRQEMAKEMMEAMFVLGLYLDGAHHEYQEMHTERENEQR